MTVNYFLQMGQIIYHSYYLQATNISQAQIINVCNVVPVYLL